VDVRPKGGATLTAAMWRMAIPWTVPSADARGIRATVAAAVAVDWLKWECGCEAAPEARCPETIAWLLRLIAIIGAAPMVRVAGLLALKWGP
jgi:hypothetical protein